VVRGRPRFPRVLALQFAMDEGGEEKEEDNNGNYDEDDQGRDWEEEEEEEEEEQEERNVGVSLDDARRCDYRVTCRALVLHPTKYNRDLFLQKVIIIPPRFLSPFSQGAKAQQKELTSFLFVHTQTHKEPRCGFTTPAPHNGNHAARHPEANFPFPARSFFVGVRDGL